MSIKTDGLLEGGPFKVTGSVPGAGFVKNLADGTLVLGQAASAWDLIEFKTFSSPLSNHFFDAVVDGDVDDTYQVIFQAFGPASAARSSGRIIFNGVSTVAGFRFTSQTAFSTGQFRSLGDGWQCWREFGGFTSTAGVYGRAIIHAKTGKVRTGISWMTAQRKFGVPFRDIQTHYAQRWNDTTTNITQIGFRGTSGRVSRAWLYKIKTA